MNHYEKHQEFIKRLIDHSQEMFNLIKNIEKYGTYEGVCNDAEKLIQRIEKPQEGGK